MKRRRNRVAAILGVASLVAGGMAPVAAVDGAARTGAVGAGGLVNASAPVSEPAVPDGAWDMTAVLAAVSTATSSRCPTSVSCGSGCVATLQTGVCILGISWTGRVGVGGIQIGPSFRFECYVCDCWYTYTSPTGTQVFKRVTDGNCGGSFGGIILE